ncbi:uroporphyrinogen-III C-methyltransferase [Lentilactobacillus kisonensis]|uniref:uroporphyrinogen-III C-methyltransferase n=1 Tax=Lentilactobacillus kisonensis TaxID=481722 RepID=UPI000AD1E1F3|nr:uroporphyrinogen-III C-methyltransferase [Lentilactobacillus kisonensis]
MSGFVSLVGAGPGNPELLTLLAKRRLVEADVILYDRLVNPALLMETTAETIDVGKLPHHHKYSQYKINDLLVTLANQGKRVVRLKAGDPYVFGRGGEESQFLKANHVDYEVVPGITSAIAGLGAVGIPITHRDFASSFHVITGHRKKTGEELDWPNIAHQEGTLVFLMGMEQLENIVDNLIKNGKDQQTPVAVIQWATHWNQRSVLSDLTHIAEVVTKEQIGSPALIVVGKVAELMKTLQPKPALFGQHILVPYKLQSRLFSQLQDAGASVGFFQRGASRQLDFQLPDLTKPASLLVYDISAYQSFQEKNNR